MVGWRWPGNKPRGFEEIRDAPETSQTTPETSQKPPNILLWQRLLLGLNVIFFLVSIGGVVAYTLKLDDEEHPRDDVTWTVVLSGKMMETGQTCDSVGSRFCRSWDDRVFAIDADVQLNRDVKWYYIIIAIMFFQMAASFCYLQQPRISTPNSWRWFEYTLTSPLQIVFIAFTLLSCNVYVQILLGSLQFALMFFGDAIEWMLYDNESKTKHSKRVWWYFLCALIIHSVIWGILFKQLTLLISEFENVPGIVYAIVIIEFLCFTSFGVLLLVAIMNNANAKDGKVDWEQNDLRHYILSASSKNILDALFFGYIFM